MQVLPQPDDQASFQYRGRELTRVHFGSDLVRPFLYPLIGPAGCSYTRMGHPHDVVGHRHHTSVWISHMDVAGVDFWADTGGGRIVCERVEAYHDGPKQAWTLLANTWRNAHGTPVMRERRRIAVEPMAAGAWQMLIDIELKPPGRKAITLGATPFGLLGVRVAKTISVNDGGGRILNSKGQVNEKHIFRKPARWVDYSGPVTASQVGGITLMDHPDNRNHPAPFHVRNDGWMGPCLTLHEPMTLQPDNTLRLRYGLYVHAGVPTTDAIEPVWRAFAQTQRPALESDHR
jgi:hypothetical protein